MTLLRLIEKAAYIVAYPVIFVIMNNSERSRVVIFWNKKILVVRPRLNFGYWVLPGGGVKKSESPAESAAREIHEEVGIVIRANDLVLVDKQSVKSRNIRTDLYIFASQINYQPVLKIEWYEIAEAKWITPKDLKKLPMAKREKRLLEGLLTP